MGENKEGTNNKMSFEMLQFMNKQQEIILENMKTKNKTKFYRNYDPELVNKYLSNPAVYEKNLREISRYLATSSLQYWRLVNYLPSIAILKPILVPFNSEKIETNLKKAKKVLMKTMTKLDSMEINSEYKKVLKVVFREDVFYGYEIETDSSYYIKQLDSDYCKITGVYDGSFSFKFDLSYFNSKREELLEYNSVVDSNIVGLFNDYRNKGEDFRWVSFDLNKQVCVKMQDTFAFCSPPFLGAFNDLYDIADYKELNKASAELDNSRFIGLKMPLKKDSQNLDDWSLNTTTMKEYFSFISSCLMGQYGLFMTPMEFQDVTPQNKTTVIDNVSNATKAFWNATGVADVLVGENKNAGTLKFSLITDESILFDVYRQIERILSRKIKLLTNSLYKVLLPDITYFNANEEFDKYLKASQFGFQGSKTMGNAVLGISQNQSYGLGLMENEMLKMQDTMIPVQSSHTQSSDSGESGAKEKKAEDLTESGQQTRDDEENKNR